MSEPCTLPPAGDLCGWCGETVLPGDVAERIPAWEGGAWHVHPWHEACRVRAVMGGLNHLKGLCSCCGGDLPPDPPMLSRREAAHAAWRYIREGRPIANFFRYSGRRDDA